MVRFPVLALLRVPLLRAVVVLLFAPTVREDFREEPERLPLEVFRPLLDEVRDLPEPCLLWEERELLDCLFPEPDFEAALRLRDELF